MGYSDRYRQILKEAARLARSTAHGEAGRVYTTIMVYRGHAPKEAITADGSRAVLLWTWSPKKSVSVRLGKANKVTLHSRIVEIMPAQKLTFQGDFEKAAGILFSNPFGKVIEEEETTRELEALHLQPRGLRVEDGEESTTDFEAEEQENEKKYDPSEGLPPVIMSQDWAAKGPPLRGAGW